MKEPLSNRNHYPPIGILSTCFREKFGVPRQSLMMSEAKGVLKLAPHPSFKAALNQLERFSHVWIIFVFHRHENSPWHPIIMPPTLTNEKEIGVFASRSPHRPNPIGLSVVKLDRIDFESKGGIEIHLSGLDILDGTPVLDIKPYLPYADSVANANSGWAIEEIKHYPVEFSLQSLTLLETISKEHPHIKTLITQMLELDPRPTSQRRSHPILEPESEGLKFAFRVLNLDVHWQVKSGTLWVYQIVQQTT